VEAKGGGTALERGDAALALLLLVLLLPLVDVVGPAEPPATRMNTGFAG
jgi:hypothetical protein